MNEDETRLILESDKFFCPPDVRQALHNELAEGNLAYGCPPMLVMLAADTDPNDSKSPTDLPEVLKGRRWEAPVEGMGAVTQITPCLGDLLEILNSEAVESVEVEGVYRYTEDV